MLKEDDYVALNRKQYFDQWEQLIKTKKTVNFPADFNSAQEFLDIDNDLPSNGLLTNDSINF